MGTPAALLARCRFPAAGSAVTCAVSGGADSLALLVLAAEAGCVVTAVHVDHGLRAGSAAEGDVVAEVARRVGAAFEQRRVHVAPGPNLEARARAARYAVLPEAVCTGHTADDQAETILLQLLRGGGLAAYAGMRAGSEARVQRPILALRRHETQALCASLGLAAVDDPMNADPRFTRVRVRHELLPLLDDLAARDVAPVLGRNAELAADALDALDAAVAAVDPTDVRALRALARPFARWAVRRWLTAASGAAHAPDAASIDRVLAVVDGEVRAAEIVGGGRVARRDGRLRYEAPSGQQAAGS